MINLHGHTDVSNFRLIDSITKIEDLIQTSADLGLRGCAVTDHESVSNFLKAIEITKKLKEENKIPQDFLTILGNEIYMVNSLEEVRDNYQSGVTKFPHFLLLAKNEQGNEALRRASSKAWSNSFFTGLMERVPITKNEIREIVEEYPNTLIASTACLGSESSIHILNNDDKKAKEFLMWCSNLFGKGNFYLEMQPSKSDEQKKVNKKLIEFSRELNLPLIITTDAHYLRPEDAEIHAAYLNSKSSTEREVASFYESCYIHTVEEIYQKLDYLNKEIIEEALENTLKIGEMIEDYTLEKPIIIPKTEIPEFELKHLFKHGYKDYKYIEKMANSSEEQDRYMIHLVEEGFIEKLYSVNMTKPQFKEIMERIDIEIEQLWCISEEISQPLSAYYVTVANIVSIMWADSCGEDSFEKGSLVGSGRGSAASFLINYLMGITEVNPLAYGIDIPYWRHMHKSRGDISSVDIDLDNSPNQRQFIYQRLKEFYGEDRFLQVCTFGTEKSKSAIQTACRGLGYDSGVGQFISSLIPFERGENYSISDCLYGNEDKGRKPVKEFVKELEKYPKLKKTAQRIEGLINKRSIHAGGVILTNEPYYKTNAAMRAPNSSFVTQFDLGDTQKMGSIKYDLLGVSGIEKIQVAINMLIEDGIIEKEETLRKTFEKHFHPEIIDKENPKLFDLVAEGKVPDLFQFSTDLAMGIVKKAKPSNLIEITATNSLMRLMSESGEQPIDTFIKYKNDISKWYEEMEKHNLTKEEISVLEDHLLPLNGIADTQESAMKMAMDQRIAGFDVTQANVLRKSIAKRSGDALEKAKRMFFENGIALNNSENLLNYVWNVQIGRMLG